VAIKLLIIFLLFVSVWVGLIVLAWYRSRRPAPWSAPAGALPAGRQADRLEACCLEVPCSAKCAENQQKMRDRLEHRYDLVAAEALKVINQSQPGGDA
jgi:hypothetical protein